MGVIIDISEPEYVKLRNGSSKVRKYLTLIDDTFYSIVVTLWGEMCEKNPNLS